MSYFTQYVCVICNNVRTYGTGWPDDRNQLVFIQCGKCGCNTQHRFKTVGDVRELGGLPSMSVRA